MSSQFASLLTVREIGICTYRESGSDSVSILLRARRHVVGLKISGRKYIEERIVLRWNGRVSQPPVEVNTYLLRKPKPPDAPVFRLQLCGGPYIPIIGLLGQWPNLSHRQTPLLCVILIA